MKVYMAVTRDEIELPIAIDDTLKGLSRTLGIRWGWARTALCQRNGCVKRKGERLRLIKVSLENDTPLPFSDHLKALAKMWGLRSE